ncbi:MAG: hypothetical protein CMA98_02100, partial [Euryarchaeota archaeon]|nr:hypothetical protein [Euryarchaeota archaeon]
MVNATQKSTNNKPLFCIFILFMILIWSVSPLKSIQIESEDLDEDSKFLAYGKDDDDDEDDDDDDEDDDDDDEDDDD